MYNSLPDSSLVDELRNSLQAKGYKIFIANNRNDALSEVKNLIPKGVTLNNGSSTTLEEIGFIQLLKSKARTWDNLHDKIVNESNIVEQSRLRKMATTSDYYVGSVHAITKDGDFVIASNTGSQLPNIVYSSTNLIFVVGLQKLVNDIPSAMDRLTNYVVPLEEERSKKVYGVSTSLNKILIFKGESEWNGRTINFILVNEVLGF